MSETEKDRAIAAMLDQIEQEMKQIGFWSRNPPAFEVNSFQDAPSFELWLQCVFLPNARAAAASGHYPATSQVGQMAMREYDYHSHVPEAQTLLRLLNEFDRLVEGAAINTPPPRPRVPPLLLLAAAALVMAALTALVPAAGVGWNDQRIIFGAGITVAGSLIVVLGVIAFRRAGTTVDPRFPERASQLVISGIYRWTRNPMYLGFAVFLLGWSLVLGNLVAALVVPVWIAYIDRFQILPEEQALEARFGDSFKAYRRRVRRWM